MQGEDSCRGEAWGQRTGSERSQGQCEVTVAAIPPLLLLAHGVPSLELSRLEALRPGLLTMAFVWSPEIPRSTPPPCSPKPGAPQGGLGSKAAHVPSPPHAAIPCYRGWTLGPPSGHERLDHAHLLALLLHFNALALLPGRGCRAYKCLAPKAKERLTCASLPARTHTAQASPYTPPPGRLKDVPHPSTGAGFPGMAGDRTCGMHDSILAQPGAPITHLPTTQHHCPRASCRPVPRTGPWVQLGA